MLFEGQYDIPAAKDHVWVMLNDPEVLKYSIPGCQSLSGGIDEGFTATVKVGIGPVKATFEGSVTLEDLDPPSSYRIVGAGKGGVAGFASGEARVALTDIEGGTRLTYAAEVAVGGKIAQLGARLLKSSVAKLTDQFFAEFAARAAGGTRA
jgi:carbon monoxide dehydrogenase subunit G